jgi:hypothetical protein
MCDVVVVSLSLRSAPIAEGQFGFTNCAPAILMKIQRLTQSVGEVFNSVSAKIGLKLFFVDAVVLPLLFAYRFSVLSTIQQPFF